MKMQKIVAVFAFAALAATAAYAAPTAVPGSGVINSVHDMNVVDGLAPDTQGRVCAFCHTPHHALSDAVVGDYNPLWSHDVTGIVAPIPYETSTFDAAGAVDPLAGPSRLCMSCHDGAIAPDQHYGGLFPGTAGLGGKFTADDFGDIAVGLNGDFSNDHPIGFDVTNSATDVEIKDFWTDQAPATAEKWNTVNNSGAFGVGTVAIAKGLYPVAPGAPGSIFTCATCHDVHNQDNVPNDVAFDANHVAGNMNYLVFAPQSGSALCLSCHLK